MKDIEVKVGAFVLLCAALLCGTIYYVSYAKFSGAHVRYRTYLRNAPGMEPGAPVLFGGITVGAVRSVQPDNTDPTRIEIAFDVKQGTPINAKSVAGIGTVSLMRAALAISTGSNNAPRPRSRGSGAIAGNDEPGRTAAQDGYTRRLRAGHTLNCRTDINNLTETDGSSGKPQ